MAAKEATRHDNIKWWDKCCLLLQIEREAAFSQFTMVIITGIRDIHINSIREDGGSSLARNLAHVYHFYLFGERGRTGNMKLPALSNSRIPVSILNPFYQ